jgi:hypothetical protein
MPYALLYRRRGNRRGNWSAGVRVPFGFPLKRLSLAVTPDLEAAADADGHSFYLAFGSVAGLTVALAGSVAAARDRDRRQSLRPTTEMLAVAPLAGSPAATSIRRGRQCRPQINRPTSSSMRVFRGVSSNLGDYMTIQIRTWTCSSTARAVALCLLDQLRCWAAIELSFWSRDRAR